jgi:hypothetical protein
LAAPRRQTACESRFAEHYPRSFRGEKGSTAKAVPTPDPIPTIGSYMAHLGLEPTMDAFIEEVRKQSRANW